MIVRGEAVDVLFERVVGMERLVGVKQSLRLDGKKVCNIKMVGILQAKAIISRLVPLCRQSTSLWASKQGIVRFWEGWCGARDYCPFTMVVRRAIFGATNRHCLREIGTVSL